MNNGFSQKLVNQFVGACHGNFEAVKTMLEEHPGLVNAVSSDNEAALQAAAHTAQKNIAEYLLDKGAELDICTAALLGRTAAVSEMLEADGSLIKATGAHSIPLTYYPVVGGHTHMLDLLAGRGADLNAGDGIITALHAAVFADNVEALEWLISMRASPFVKNVNGDTPLEMAVKLKRKRAEEALRHCNGG